MSQTILISRSELCKLFNCKPPTIQKWVVRKGFPQPLPCPAREPVFRYKDVLDWVEGKSGLEAKDVQALSYGTIHDTFQRLYESLRHI